MCFYLGKNAFSALAVSVKVDILCGNKWSYAFFGVWLHLESHTFYILEVIMPNFEEMYYTLFRAITKALENIDDANYGTARDLLIQAQQQTEEVYISAAPEV